jgi:hypothetical protein
MYPIWNGRIFLAGCDYDSSAFPNVLQCICTPEFNHLQQGQAGIPDPLRGGAWVHF